MTGIAPRLGAACAADAARAPRRLPTIPADAEAFGAHAVLRLALETMGASRLPLSTSLEPEGIVILDLLSDMEAHPRVITVDTGRLPEQTHDADRPRARPVRRRHRGPAGPTSDRRGDGPRARPEPLLPLAGRPPALLRGAQGAAAPRRSASVDGWITGLRRDQSTTRRTTPKISLDFENGLIWKVAPLADWSCERVWHYIRKRDLPYNTLHDMGYQSVGCAPCTRAVPPGEDDRSGRWWWEAPESRECGLHVDRARSWRTIGRAAPTTWSRSE